MFQITNQINSQITKKSSLNSPSPPRHLFRGASILPGTAGRTSCACCACCASQAEGPTATAGVTGGSGRQKEALATLGCEAWLENHRFLNGAAGENCSENH